MRYFYRVLIALIVTPFIIPLLWIAVVFNKNRILNNVDEMPIMKTLFDKAKL